MRVLVDTNILARSVIFTDKDHQTAIDAVAILRSQGHEICLVPQNYYEFWVISTRPVAQNGRGKTPDEVAAKFAFFKLHFTLLDDIPLIFPEWEKLVAIYKVIGKSAHDARLAAAMLAHGVSHILTFNDADFRRYAGISAIRPASVSATPGSP